MSTTDMTALNLTIERLLPEPGSKIIMVSGSQQGEGVSTIACELAIAAATKLGKKVLVLDAAHRNPSQHSLLRVRRPNVTDKNDCSTGLGCSHSSVTNLCVATFPKTYGDTSTGDPFQKILWCDLKSCFDLVVIDSSSVLSVGQISLVRHVDGVLLVMAAEKSDRSTVGAFIAEVHAYGGNLLGVVFNKRKDHVPPVLLSWVTRIDKLLDGYKEKSSE